MNNDMTDQTVTIIFEDEDITLAFAELLHAVGVRTHIVRDWTELNGADKIITEPQYFYRLDEGSRERCLVVGNREVLEQASGCTLSRPLTEEKVERALAAFLAL